MALEPSTTLGHYEIRVLIGVGGMGEVYRARDTKLDRDVAIKILPEAFARDSDRVARFKREAKLLASLNHPNIATIHGLEESNDLHFLVMEMVEGETLRELIRDSRSSPSPDRERGATSSVRKGPLAYGRGSDTDGGIPLDDALEITKQICAALEHAHEKTVMHRDLKPANVKVTPEGKVKVLDFGLAKAFAGDGAASGSATPIIDSNSPTLSRLPTGYQQQDFSPTLPGVILGTAAYMSPEQARGKIVDKRTDIWALGCVLYELLTGEGPFSQSRARQQADMPTPAKGPLPHGRGSDGAIAADQPDTVQDIIARVLQSDPDWSLLPATTPPAIVLLLRRCLQKDKTQRLRGAADIAIALEDALNATPATTQPQPAPAVPAKSSWKRKLAFAAGGLTAWAITAYVIWITKPAAPPPQVTRTIISLAPNEQLVNNNTYVMPLAISPDGSHLVYVAQKGSQTASLYVRSMDSLDDRPLIPGTENQNPDGPFFSPDGKRVGFFAGTVLKQVSLDGGPVTTLFNAGTARGASWSADDRIVFPVAANSGLSVVSSAGGTPVVLTKLEKSEASHRWPEVLPGGTAMLYVVAANTAFFDTARIMVQRLDTGEQKVLIQGGTYPHYVPTGHLVYYRAGTIMAVPFDLKRLEVKGSPVPVMEGVMASPTGSGGAKFTISTNGTLVYVPGGASESAQNRLVWVDRHGVTTPIKAPPHGYGGNSGPKLSSDGKSLAVMIQEEGTDTWIYDFARDTLTRLTFDGTLTNIAWTPDGKRVVYTSANNGPNNIFWKPADGSGAEGALVKSEYQVTTGSFTPDGRIYTYGQISPKTGRDIWYETVDDRKPHVFLQTQFNETSARLSPDGRYVAYISDESGRNEIYVQPFPGPGGKYQISTEGGRELTWGANGEIFYRNGQKMMAVEVKTQPTLQVGKAQMLFEGDYLLPTGAGAYFDVTPDGQRFVMMKGPEQAAAATQIIVVQNWFEELKQKVPPGK